MKKFLFLNVFIKDTDHMAFDYGYGNIYQITTSCSTVREIFANLISTKNNALIGGDLCILLYYNIIVNLETNRMWR